MDGKRQRLAGTTVITIDEAVAYTGIGQNTFRRLLRKKGCPFVFWYGTTAFIVKEELDKYIDGHNRI